jgi:hypothetical protein
MITYRGRKLNIEEDIVERFNTCMGGEKLDENTLDYYCHAMLQVEPTIPGALSKFTDDELTKGILEGIMAEINLMEPNK